MDTTGVQDYILEQIRLRGWSMRELARRSKISDSMVTNTLSGHRTPTLKFCTAIAKPLEIDPADLLRMAGLLPKQHRQPDTYSSLPTMEDMIRDLWQAHRDKPANVLLEQTVEYVTSDDIRELIDVARQLPLKAKAEVLSFAKFKLKGG